MANLVDRAALDFIMGQLGYREAGARGASILYRSDFSPYEPRIAITVPPGGMTEDDLRRILVDSQGVPEGTLNTALEQL